MITKQQIEDLTKDFNSELGNMTTQQLMNLALDGYISRALRKTYVSQINQIEDEVQQEETV